MFGCLYLQDGDDRPSLPGSRRFSELRAVKQPVLPCVTHSWHLVQNSPLPLYHDVPYIISSILAGKEESKIFMENQLSAMWCAGLSRLSRHSFF